MKQKQARRLMKAAKKMRRIQSGELTGDQVVNNFEYMLNTYKLLHKGGNDNENNNENNDENN